MNTRDIWWPNEGWVPPSGDEEERPKRARVAKKKAAKRRRKRRVPDVDVKVYVQSGDSGPGASPMSNAVEALKSEPEWTFL